jgi:hypothetical protein
MNSKSGVPTIPLEGSIRYADWLKGRRFRRELSERLVRGSIRRSSSSSDKRLRELFHGERGLPFAPTDQL